jgi:hypothetical protein
MTFSFWSKNVDVITDEAIHNFERLRNSNHPH